MSGKHMIVEQRTFTFLPGKVPEYLALYREVGLRLQSKHLAQQPTVYVSECGPLNQVTAIWKFESFEQRDRLRVQLKADPEWKPYLARIHPLMTSMENRIWTPVELPNQA